MKANIRGMMREAVALARNYRQAAALRRQLRCKHGVVVLSGPGVLIGEALVAIMDVRWRRVAMALAILLVVSRLR